MKGVVSLTQEDLQLQGRGDLSSGEGPRLLEGPLKQSVTLSVGDLFQPLSVWERRRGLPEGFGLRPSSLIPHWVGRWLPGFCQWGTNEMGCWFSPLGYCELAHIKLEKGSAGSLPLCTWP